MVVENLDRLVRLGMLGTYGLYEAVDFTLSRLPLGKTFEFVRSYMAHHQGMILLSLANYFTRHLTVRRFHADPYIQSVELLLQEQIPTLPGAAAPENGRLTCGPAPGSTSLAGRFRPAQGDLLSRRYGVMINNAGSAAWRQVDLTRWRADTTLNDGGCGFTSRICRRAPCGQPTPARGPYQSRGGYNAHMAIPPDEEISLVMEITVPPDDDPNRGLRRRTSSRRRLLRLCSYAEVVLSSKLRCFTRVQRVYRERRSEPGVDPPPPRRRPKIPYFWPTRSWRNLARPLFMEATGRVSWGAAGHRAHRPLSTRSRVRGG
jgi:cyclic beta-1,2-glucan synthetase